MNVFRKLTAFLLIVTMFLSLIIVPSSATQEMADEMITREYSLFDLSGVAVGSSTTGDDSVLPAGVEEAGIERNNQTKDFTGVSYHSGTQEVVEFQGQKMLKVVFDKASAQGNEDINNAKGVYSIKMNVPAGFSNYVKDISVEFAQYDKLGGNLRYRMGVIGDDKYGTQTYNVGYYGGGVVKMSVADFMAFSTFYKASDKWSWTIGNKSLGKWTSPVEEVFLFFSSEAAKVDGGTGYCLLKDVKVTITAPKSVYDNLPIEGKVNLLDMSHAKVGPITTVDYPVGVAEYEFDASIPMLPNTEGVRNVALNSQGKKVFQLDLSKVPFERTKDDKNYIGNTAGYKPLYYIKLTDIPAKHIPYIQDIAIKMRKSSNTTKVVYEFGVANGSYLSREIIDNNFGIEPSNTSRVVHEINPKKLKKVQNKWRVTGYHQGGWNSWDYWDDDYTGLFLILSAYNADATAYGTLDIEEISYTYAAPKSEQKYFPKTQKINLLDMYNAPLGEIANSQYPSGVVEANFHNSDTFTNAGGIKRVVKNDGGNKVLQLDLSSVTFEKKKDENYIGNTAQYNPVYYIKLANIPTGYIPYIENIGIKMKKSSSTTKVIYELGVSDGTSYSRATRNGNMVIGVSDTATHAYEVNITNLKKVPKIWNVSDYIDETIWAGYEYWDDSYTTIFLALVADNAADRANAGTLDIEEISCTLAATGTMLDELNDKLQESKKLVNDFENELGTETEFAAGGAKAFRGEGNRIKVPVSHPDLAAAKGISFWVYNSGSSTTYPYYGVRLSTGARYLDGHTSISAGAYKYIEIDFSRVGIEVSQYRYDGAFESMVSADTSLTTAQRAAVSYIEMTCSGSMSLLVDNIYLITDDNHATRETADIKINSNTVTGTKVVDGNVVNSGVSVKNGKIFIPASAEDQTVAISIPEGTLTNATQLIYNFTSNASAARLRFYTNAVFDSGRGSYSGKDAFIRFGTDPWRNTHKVNAKSTYRHEADFYANSGNHNTCVSIIWADDKDKFKWPGTTCVWANPAEKAKTTAIYVDVEAFGDPTNESDYITLDYIKLISRGASISAGSFEGGNMTISTNLAFIGSQVEFYITTNEGYYLQDVVVTDSFGKNVPIAKSAYLGGDKFGDCYSFTIPAANVTVVPKFSLIANTFDSDIAYNGDNLNVSYSNPVNDGKVYNELTGNFEPISNSGVIVAPQKALSKYGFTEKDLTYQNIKKWQETGHHLAKYIVALDDEGVLDYTMGVKAINFDIEFTDVSINARRELETCVVSYVNFKDNLGTVANAIRTSDVKKLDKHVYGDGLKETFQPHKGINYSGGGELGATTAFEKMKDINDKGFDFIRLPVWVNLDENDRVRQEGLASDDKKVENALKLGMSVIVDLHNISDVNGKTNISADYAGTVQKYYNSWEVLARHYAAYPNSVIFQLVNEPRIDVAGPDPITIPEMMEMQEKLVDQIRAVPGNENRIIVIGSDVNYPLNMDRDFPDSLLNKGNIMIDFHYYSPMKFTHAGRGDDPAGVTLEEAGVNFKSMESTIKSIVDFGKRKGVQVFMGEWGALEPDYDDKLIYYTMMVELMGKHGLNWSVWGYTELFSGYVNGQWDETLLDIYFERAKYYQ